jgi:transposase InsO family protein
MNLHRNARTTPVSRAAMVRRVLFGGETVGEVALAYVTTAKTVRKWVERYQQQGLAGLEDRSSRPARLRKPTPAQTVEQIIALRRERLPGKQIALETGTSRSTVSRYLRAAKLSRARDLEPAEPVVRYERKTAGELIHLDIKKLGRFGAEGHRVTADRRSRSRHVGWEFVHVCIDDASRVAFSRIFPDERKESAIAFLKAAVAYYESLGVSISRVMTDNGAAYRSKAFAKTCRALGLKHIFTRPYTPRTNGKAERFIQTALREWAYAKAYCTSDSRAGELPAWMHRYNWHRPHGGIQSATPISRLGLTQNNLLRLHI